jgi:hypothetical protein
VSYAAVHDQYAASCDPVVSVYRLGQSRGDVFSDLRTPLLKSRVHATLEPEWLKSHGIVSDTPCFSETWRLGRRWYEQQRSATELRYEFGS